LKLCPNPTSEAALSKKRGTLLCKADAWAELYLACPKQMAAPDPSGGKKAENNCKANFAFKFLKVIRPLLTISLFHFFC
jgi:hypothetical protein